MNRTRTQVPASRRPVPASRRHASWLRTLSLLLALCCFWSFAGSGIALAAVPDHGKMMGNKAMGNKATGRSVPHPFPHAPAFAVAPSAFGAAPAVLRSAPAWKLTQAAPTARPRPTVSPDTMLDEVGRLAHAVPAAQPLAWKQELAANPPARRAALLHVRLGEWQMAANEQPGTARRHFRQAQALVPRTDPLHGLAAYDAAIALMFQGAYQDAQAAFHALIVPKSAGRGYDRSYAALWERHAGACAGYHAQRSAAGIPEPPRLDPQCGAAGLASSLRALALPYDKKTVLAACRVTGRGSNAQDLLDAAPRLHVRAALVSADEQGLKLLPKPLIAYVEHDHFISVIKADDRGVSYLCSDCGMWPGGRVDLTWGQWRLLEATLYLAVTRPGSAADRMLAAALAPAAQPQALQAPPLRVSFTGSLSRLGGSLRIHLPALLRLRGHVFGHVAGTSAACGYQLGCLHCKPGQKPPMDGPGDGPGKGGKPGGGNGPTPGPTAGPMRAALAGGPGDGDPVNLATGEEEYAPPADLVVYNPHGPAVGWGRTWQSLRPADSAYQSDDFGPGWSQPYNLQVNDPTVTAPVNPQALSGSGSSFAASGSEAPGAGLTWDVVLGGSTVASSASPGGWAVTGVYGPPSSLTVTVPAGTSAAAGFKVRYNFGSSYNGSALFDVVSSYSVPQGGAAQFTASGTAPAADGWDVLKGGVTVASSVNPGGWQVALSSSSSAVMAVQAPLNVAPGGGYEARCGNYTGAHSAFFSVGASRLAGATGPANYKYVVLPNGGRVQFTAASVPTAANPKVACAVELGMPLLVEWDYDAASPAGHYTVTMADRTRWVTGVPVKELVSAGSGYPYGYNLIYQPSQIVDRSGNGLTLTYGYTNPADGWPLLTGIADASTGTTLLSLNRDTNGGLTSVSDAYGRSVVYHLSVYGSVPGVDQVSQIIPTAAISQSGLPSRYAYGYTLNYPDNIASLRLHTITVPSPTGSGTSTATINYDGQAYVGSLVDGNGNTRAYSSYNMPSTNGTYGTQVTVTDAGSHLVYSYAALYGSNMNVTAYLNAQGVVTAQYVYADLNDPNGPSAVYDGDAVAQVPQNGSATLTITGADGPASSGWDVVSPAGTVTASSGAPGGWNVAYSNGSLVVSAPSGAAVGSGYEARCQQGYIWSAFFSVIASGTSPKQPTKYIWDGYGNLHQEKSPRGTVTDYTYGFPSGAMPSVVNSQLKSDAFALGELLKVQEGTNLSSPKAPMTYAYFEPSGLVQSVTAPLPGTTGSASTVTTSYTYDATSQGSHGLGNVLTVTAPGNNAASTITTTLNYTTDGSYSQAAAMGQPVSVTNSLGKVTHLRYDAQGNTAAVKDALGNETDLTYDIRNAPLQTVLPATGQTGSGHGGSQVAYLYAEPSSFATSQWPAATLQYGPATTATVYDEGNVGAVRQTVSAYGLEGELKQVTGSTEPVAYAYDGLYRLKTFTDGGGHVTSYFYNPAGYLYQTVYPGAQATPPTAPLAAGSFDTLTYPSYDGDGNLLSRVDGRNQTTTYAYNDPESRLTAITYPAGTIGAVGLSYDAYGRTSTMTDGTGGQTYAYDDDNALTGKTVTWTGLTAKTISYGFYANGSRQSMNADGHSFAYSYDGVGRMSSLSNDGSTQATYAYQDNGWLLTKTLGNTDVTTYTRDPQGRLRDLANKKSDGTVLSDFSVPATGGYDGAGNRLSMTATVTGAPGYSGTTSYQYDYGQSANPQLNRSQLTQETNTGYYGTIPYLYDQPGYSNPGTSTGPGNLMTAGPSQRSYNVDNQLTNTPYTYDGNGSPTKYHGYAVTSDPESRITAYGSLQTAGYDGDGLRAWKQTGSGRTYFLYDGSQPIGEYNSTGTLHASNVFGADGLISRLDPTSPVNTGRTYYSFDLRGSVTERLYANGNSYQVDLYDGLGNRSEALSDYSDPWGFGAQAGYFTDLETGLILCTHRFYDPPAGRFVTRDPLGYAGGINLYGYTRNNPVNGSDPSGYGGEVNQAGGGSGSPGPDSGGGKFPVDGPIRPPVPRPVPTPRPPVVQPETPFEPGGGAGEAAGWGLFWMLVAEGCKALFEEIKHCNSDPSACREPGPPPTVYDPIKVANPEPINGNPWGIGRIGPVSYQPPPIW